MLIVIPQAKQNPERLPGPETPNTPLQMESPETRNNVRAGSRRIFPAMRWTLHPQMHIFVMPPVKNLALHELIG